MFYPRLVCPFCGNQEPGSLGYFHVEGEEARYRAATCEVCNGYMKMVSSLERFPVGFWNVSGRDVLLTVGGQRYLLARNRSITLNLGRTFAWQVDQQVPRQVSESGLNAILVAPQLSTDDAKSVLGPVLETAENAGRDLIALVGADAGTVDAIKNQAPTNDRIILTTPGIQALPSGAGTPPDKRKLPQMICWLHDSSTGSVEPGSGCA